MAIPESAKSDGSIDAAEAARLARTAKVVHVTTAHNAEDARILFREAAGLRSAGVEAAVFGPTAAPHVVEGVPVYPLRQPRSRLWRILSASWRAVAAVSHSRAKLVQFHDPELLPAALMTKWFLRRRVVYDAHEDVSLMGLKDWVPRWLRRPLAAMMSGIDAFCAGHVDAVVTPTRLLKEKYQALAPRAETFINYPASAFLRERDEAWKSVSRRENVVVHLGTLRKSRIEFLVNVAKEFFGRHPDWKMELIGLHPHMQAWLEENLPQSLRGLVIGLGKIPHIDVAKRLCRAKIGVNYHPLDSRQIEVAIPLKVFEYLACGLPTVSTKVPLLVELVEDCSSVKFCEDDVDAYVSAMNGLTDSGSLEQLAGTARRFSDERFNCTAEAAKLVKLYDDILSGRLRNG